jgi:hypothetical protein
LQCFTLSRVVGIYIANDSVDKINNKGLSMRILCGMLFTLMLTSGVAVADIVDPNEDNLIFSYDVDPGELSGELISNSNKIGEIDAFDYSESTFSFWVNISGVFDGWMSVFHIGDGSRERYPGVFFFPNSTQIHYRIDAVGYDNQQVGDEEIVPTNEWVMITSTISNGVSSLYFNDELLSEYYFSIDWTDEIGKTWSVYAGDPWYTAAIGHIDDIRVYDIAISQDDVSDLVASNIAINDVSAPLMSGVMMLGLGIVMRRRKRA